MTSSGNNNSNISASQGGDFKAVDTAAVPQGLEVKPMAPPAAEQPNDGQRLQEEASKPKTAKEVEREKRKAEKVAKFQAKETEKKLKQTEALSADTLLTKAKQKATKPDRKIEDEALPPYVNDTPRGQKKRIKPFDHPHFKSYDPIAVESSWYDWWEEEGFFKPKFTPDGKVKEKGNFVIVHPPPNVTGNLHMGHALGNAIQDCMIRWNRMLGKTTLFLPGCDHAGIATQSVVENMLWRRQKQTRHDLGREKFIKKIWEWKEEYHVNINKALRRLGGSFDWSREAFSMDKNLTAAVLETFVTLFDQGIIYRANRLVHWCMQLNTALSNVEVVSKELKGRTLLDVPGYDKKVEFGIIVHFKYPIEGSEETIEVATTRPETMLGDTGIAVHPDDVRYKHLIGKKAVHPFIKGRLLPIISDAEHVKMEFGTGAVKLTPAHDFEDFKTGMKHNLEVINIMTEDGLFNENAGEYQGLKRFDVRYIIQEDLQKKGLFVAKKDNEMKVPLCERTKDVIEPYLKPQWYMKMEQLAEAAVESVRDGQVKIRPEASEKNFYHWMESITDWCLSRQLWWGHQIPVYRAKVEGEAKAGLDSEHWFAGRTAEEAESKAKLALGDQKFTLIQDSDVLDTWFSSGLWPFATLGWPNKTDDLEKLFPTTVMESGWDILFFWICRMIMFSLKMTGKIPFNEVFFHTLVRDSEGRKMSKSLGNVVDPIDIMDGIPLEDLHQKLRAGNLNPNEVEKAIKYQKTAFPNGIPSCGADGLRFWALSMSSGGTTDIAMDIQQLHAYRKFSNKIFQAAKYVLGKLPQGFTPATSVLRGKTLAEQWILHKMTIACRDVNEVLLQRDFAKATSIVYQYWYSYLCDVYIENSKSILQNGTEKEQESARYTLYTALDVALRMIHPFMPFISEELWQRMPRRPGDDTKSIMIAEYPVYDKSLDMPGSEEAYERVLGCSRAVRSLTSEYGLKENAKIFVQAYDEPSLKTIQAEVGSIASLCGKGVAEILVSDSLYAPRPLGCVAFTVSSSLAVFLEVRDRVDLNAELDKAGKKLERARGQLERQYKLLADPEYQNKVAPLVFEENKQRLADLKSEVDGHEGTIKQFEQLKLE